MLAQSKTPDAIEDEALAAARKAWAAGDLDTVFVAVSRGLARPGGTTAPLLELMAHALLKAGMPAEAAEAYEAAGRIVEQPFAYLKQASAAWMAGDRKSVV